MNDCQIDFVRKLILQVIKSILEFELRLLDSSLWTFYHLQVKYLIRSRNVMRTSARFVTSTTSPGHSTRWWRSATLPWSRTPTNPGPLCAGTVQWGLKVSTSSGKYLKFVSIWEWHVLLQRYDFKFLIHIDTEFIRNALDFTLVNSIFIYQKGLDLCLEKEFIQIQDVSISFISVPFKVLVIRLCYILGPSMRHIAQPDRRSMRWKMMWSSAGNILMSHYFIRRMHFLGKWLRRNASLWQLAMFRRSSVTNGPCRNVTRQRNITHDLHFSHPF